MNVNELQKEHDLYSDMFKNLGNEIDMQQVLLHNTSITNNNDSRMYVNQQEFAKFCKHQLDILIDKAPAIPKSIVKKFNASNEGSLVTTNLGAMGATGAIGLTLAAHEGEHVNSHSVYRGI